MGVISRLAASADIPVFPIVGVGGRATARTLSSMVGIRVVDHPRAASLLVIVGQPTAAMLAPLLAVHDQLPTPRATVWWPAGLGGVDLQPVLPRIQVLPVGDGAALRRVFVELATRVRQSDPPALEDAGSSSWLGVGPYGQGGTGMTGGIPFGRPLAGRGPDPDGLELDQLPLRVGPFFAPFPPGLTLHLDIQGDVIRKAAVGENPYAQAAADRAIGSVDGVVFRSALAEPVTIAALELARARHHLWWVSDVLRLHGLQSKSQRVARLADRLVAQDAKSVAALSLRLCRSWTLRSIMRGIGILASDRPGVQSGVVARASGVAEDARKEDPAYVALGFEPIVQSDGDSWARFRQRLQEAVQALVLADRAGDQIRPTGPSVEGLRGPLSVGGVESSASSLALLPDLLQGHEWSDALTVISSLDLDLEEAALGAPLDLAGR